MIIEVVGKEIEKIKGDFESYLNGLNMVGEISYSQYSELYDEGTKQIQKAYELGKSELEKEAEEFLQKKWGTSKMLILGGDAREVLADFAEPREKQIEIDAKHIRALQKQNGELTDKVKELEAQIEKMKCCENCRYREPYCEEAIRLPFGCCCEKWELREIKEK